MLVAGDDGAVDVPRGDNVAALVGLGGDGFVGGGVGVVAFALALATRALRILPGGFGSLALLVEATERARGLRLLALKERDAAGTGADRGADERVAADGRGEELANKVRREVPDVGVGVGTDRLPVGRGDDAEFGALLC